MLITIKNELNAPQKFAVIENEMLLDHYERDVTTDAGPTLEISSPDHFEQYI